ncbi:MAG: UDP-2,3-diacylglucosamine diphosphatase LpxI [Proteobacteria bacterium]|nr:UDP-2,3-diacylglucosamine diphosphatase LpxI [Pseudomonadota bacterium]
MADPLGLIAGDGRFPIEIARAARRRGRRVVAVAFRELSSPALAAEVDELSWLHLGQVGTLVETLRAAGACEVVMAGKVPKLHLYGDPARHRPDALALELVESLRDRRDASNLGALAALLENRGIRLLPQAELVPELMAAPGPQGAVDASPAQLGDAAFGWAIAKTLATQGVGQTVVVRERAVVALEALEGTDEAIRRGAALAGPGVCVVKVSMAGQDPRFDLPAIGPGTLEVLEEVQAAMLAFEAGKTVLLERGEVVRRADAAGIALLGFAATGPEPPTPEEPI